MANSDEDTARRSAETSDHEARSRAAPNLIGTSATSRPCRSAPVVATGGNQRLPPAATGCLSWSLQTQNASSAAISPRIDQAHSPSIPAVVHPLYVPRTKTRRSAHDNADRSAETVGTSKEMEPGPRRGGCPRAAAAPGAATPGSFFEGSAMAPMRREPSSSRRGISD
jgi:hypothetical protein